MPLVWGRMTCFVFSTDEESAGLVRQALHDLGVGGEFCSEGFAAVEQLSRQAFQLVIVDWDDQPEAVSLLTTARQRKAGERPLTLVIVRDDADVPKALQAGANSILRKPIVAGHCKETLATACELLKARQVSAKSALTAAAKIEPKPVTSEAPEPSLPSVPSSMESGKERTFRAGEFLQSAPPAPGGQFETESDIPDTSDPSAREPVDPLKELEPVASSVQEKAVEPEISPREKPRGLDWYLKTRGGNQGPGQPPATTQSNPELLGYEHSASAKSFGTASSPATANDETGQAESKSLAPQPEPEACAEKESSRGESRRPSRARRGRTAIAVAIVLAGCAIALAPRAPWHARVLASWNRGRQVVLAWLNPQLVTPTQAPASHEDFARAGDEYKLPVAENIPDATTDPSQIKVMPVVDPTTKTANNGTDSGEQGAAPANGSDGSSAQEQPSTGGGEQVTPPPQVGAVTAAGNSSPNPEDGAPHPTDSSPAVAPIQPPAAPKPAPQKPQVHYVSTPVKVPSSLQSQMASMTPAAGGDKPPEAAMPSIEPVSVPEAAERALLAEQPGPAYPANGGAQQGTVMVQVLVGRDGTVQDAKFLQGSLAFAKSAVEGVKQWKFKPYLMNGRAVSVQTVLTIKFTPGH